MTRIPNHNLNKSGLAAAVAGELGVSLDDGLRAVNAVLNTITRTVAAGHSVTVTNFGSWHPVQRPAAIRRNPQTGQPVTVPARQEMRVILSDALRQAIADGSPNVSIRKRPSK